FKKDVAIGGAHVEQTRVGLDDHLLYLLQEMLGSMHLVCKDEMHLALVGNPLEGLAIVPHRRPTEIVRDENPHARPRRTLNTLSVTVDCSAYKQNVVSRRAPSQQPEKEIMQTLIVLIIWLAATGATMFGLGLAAWEFERSFLGDPTQRGGGR